MVLVSAKFRRVACPGRAACYCTHCDVNSRGSKEPTMKRAVITCLLALVALSMTGCPIYPSDNLCHSHWDCAPGYTCEEATGACVALATGCTRPADCTSQSETCTSEGVCQIGSCHQLGCVAGYGCVIEASTWTCVLGAGSQGSGSAGGATGTGGSTNLGGAATSGGVTSLGGASALGGAAATGGTSSIGGNSGTGGST